MDRRILMKEVRVVLVAQIFARLSLVQRGQNRLDGEIDDVSKAVDMAVAVLRDVVKCQEVASGRSEEHIVNARTVGG
jgi:hypothetical protein